MKLIYLTFSSIPSQKANSIQIMKMCEAFATSCDELTLICRKGKIDAGNVYDFYGVEAAFEICAIPLVPIRGFDRLMYAYRMLAHIGKCDNRTLIYSRDQFVTGVLALMRRKSCRIVLELHAPPASRFWHHWLKRALCSGAVSHVVTISQALAEKTSTLFTSYPRAQIIVAHDGASEAPRESGNGFLRDFPWTDKRKVGYVGSMRPGKGMETIAQVVELMPEVEFHVVGGDEDAIQSWKTIIGSPNVFFHGFVPPAEAHEYIEKFDVLLAPYQEEVLVGDDNLDIGAWMSPLKLFEYMGKGKPIIASDLAVLREVLRHGENCLLAAPSNPGDWKDCILRIYEDDALRARIGATALRDFQENYTWNRRANRILDAVLPCRPI